MYYELAERTASLTSGRATGVLSPMSALDRSRTRCGAADGSTAAEALELYLHAPTALLGRLADEVRARKHPGTDRHLHHRPQRQLHERLRRAVQLLRVLPAGRIGRGYVLGFEEIFRKIDETIALGGGQLLLQGGHNPDLPLAWYEDLFRAVKERYPAFKLHALSPPEVIHLSRLSQLPVPRGDRSADRGRPRQHSRRRRRDPGRSRPEAAATATARRPPTNGSTSCATRTAPACARPRR